MNNSQFQKKLLSIQEHMMNFALSLTSNKEKAKDLMQDTTLRVLDNQDKYVSNINFKGWVLTVMHHIFVNDYHKVLKIQTTIDSSADLYNLDIEVNSGCQTPEGTNQLNEITEAINLLEDELKIPFVMALNGYKY